jgi:hypothetical protein
MGEVMSMCLSAAGLRQFTLDEVAEVLVKEEVNGYGIMAPSGPQV